MRERTRPIHDDPVGNQSELDIHDFLNLSEKTLLVTGASSGIGQATAIAASRQNARVALVARDVAALHVTLQQLDGEGHLVVPCDLSDLDGIGNMVRQVASEFRGIDGVAHAAGIHATAPLRAISSEQIRSLFDLNVGSAVMLAQAFRHKAVRRPGASLVLMSSAVGVVGQPGVSVYSATKGAVQTLTKSLALELARDQIRVNCVAPGIVTTPMTDSIKAAIGEHSFEDVVKAHPLGLGDPEDVAAAILFLLSGASRWITGTSLTVDGGYTAQ